MNKPEITVVGNLVGDPQLRTSKSGKPWVTFTVASTPRERNNQTGHYEDGEPMYLNCRAFGEFSENIANSLHQGVRVIVQGKLTQRAYEHEGQKRFSLDLVVDAIGPELRFATAVATRNNARGQGGFQQAQQQSQPQAQTQWGQPAVNDNPWNDAAIDEEEPF